MSFGQSSGPAATSKQVQELLTLLQAAGHADFRDARGPMGFTQRQAGGKFTRDEAESFLEQLRAEADLLEQGGGPTGLEQGPASEPSAARPPSAPRRTATERSLERYSAQQLAAELQRRGWIVMEP